jgi:hypothetical protein
MQFPPQSTSPAKHVVEHIPPLQAVPGVHGLPAPAPMQLPLAPQYALSVLGLMQLLAHRTSPLKHMVEHIPPLHAVPGTHAFPAAVPVQLPLAPQ